MLAFRGRLASSIAHSLVKPALQRRLHVLSGGAVYSFERLNTVLAIELVVGMAGIHLWVPCLLSDPSTFLQQHDMDSNT